MNYFFISAVYYTFETISEYILYININLRYMKKFYKLCYLNASCFEDDCFLNEIPKPFEFIIFDNTSEYADFSAIAFYPPESDSFIIQNSWTYDCNPVMAKVKRAIGQ